VCEGGGEQDKNVNVLEGNCFRITAKHSTITSLTQARNVDDEVDERITNKLIPWFWILLEGSPVIYVFM
jgi:hypothetical protein